MLSTLANALDAQSTLSVTLTIEPSCQTLTKQSGRYTQCADCALPFEICSECDRGNSPCKTCAQRRSRVFNTTRQRRIRSRHKNKADYKQKACLRAHKYYHQHGKLKRALEKQLLKQENEMKALTSQALTAHYSGTFIMTLLETSTQSTAEHVTASPSAQSTVPATQLNIRCLLPKKAYDRLIDEVQLTPCLRNACSTPPPVHGLINVPVLGEIACQIQFGTPVLPNDAIETCHFCHFCGVQLPKQVRRRSLQQRSE